MYTGGGECVLVKWTLANPQHKSFLPRLPAPIKHLTIAPDNLYVAVSTLDNGKVLLFIAISILTIVNLLQLITYSDCNRYCYCKPSKKIDVGNTKFYVGRCLIVQRLVSRGTYRRSKDR